MSLLARVFGPIVAFNSIRGGRQVGNGRIDHLVGVRYPRRDSPPVLLVPNLGDERMLQNRLNSQIVRTGPGIHIVKRRRNVISAS